MLVMCDWLAQRSVKPLPPAVWVRVPLLTLVILADRFPVNRVAIGNPYAYSSMENRLTVGREPLKLLIKVRILVLQ